MPGQHALLSPSGASRWLACPPSASFESSFPGTSSGAAEEGTLAHRLAEVLIRRKLGRIAKKIYDKEVGSIMGHNLYSAEMTDHCTAFALFVLEKYNEALARTKDALLFQETKVDLTRFIPESYGTIDIAIIADHHLTIIDLKYGKGVPVNAVGNTQLKIYGLGAEDEWAFLYDLDRVEMIIHQPRLDSVTSDVISMNDLNRWRDKVLIPGAILASKGEGVYKAGEHCRFCRGRAVCRTNRDYMLAGVAPDTHPNELTPAEISEILSKGDEFKNWIKAIEDFALTEAMKGSEWPGFKLVEGRSNRRYTDEAVVIGTLLAHGYNRDMITRTKLLGITELQKEIGKSDFDRYISSLLVKPPGSPTLAPATDKRPALPAGAAKDFAGLDLEEVTN